MATDLVGRGIDIERVNIVINYDMPQTDEKHGNGADTCVAGAARPAGRGGGALCARRRLSACRRAALPLNNSPAAS